MKIVIPTACNVLNLCMGTVVGCAYLMMLELVNWIWASIPMWCR